MNIPTTDIQLLQETFDRVVSKLGVKNTTQLLESFYDKTTSGIDEPGQMKLITDYVIAKSIAVFNLEENKFYNSNIPEYKQARMACYELLHRYTKSSDAKIAEQFSNNKRVVQYHRNKCIEQLELAQFYKEFVTNYRLLEKGIIQFIGKL